VLKTLFQQTISLFTRAIYFTINCKPNWQILNISIFQKLIFSFHLRYLGIQPTVTWDDIRKHEKKLAQICGRVRKMIRQQIFGSRKQFHCCCMLIAVVFGAKYIVQKVRCGTKVRRCNQVYCHDPSQPWNQSGISAYEIVKCLCQVVVCNFYLQKEQTTIALQ
jgi:hypothetical protein